MYSKMVAVQLDEVHRALVGSDVLTVIVGEESSTLVSGLGGCSLCAGSAATSIGELSREAVAAALSFKRTRARCP